MKHYALVGFGVFLGMTVLLAKATFVVPPSPLGYAGCVALNAVIGLSAGMLARNTQRA